MTSFESAPVRLADAKVGDLVTQLKVSGHGERSVVTVRAFPVGKATPKRLMVNGTWYKRNGTPLRKWNGSSRFYLTDPTAETSERLREQEQRRERAKNNAEFQQREQELNRRIAADWLASATDPETIIETLFNQTLDEVFETLQKARIV